MAVWSIPAAYSPHLHSFCRQIAEQIQDYNHSGNFPVCLHRPAGSYRDQDYTHPRLKHGEHMS